MATDHDAFREHVSAERLAEYADDVLGAVDRVETERHLALCEECRTVLIEAVAFLQEERAAESLGSAARLDEGETAVTHRQQRLLTAGAGVLALAAALLLALRIAAPEWLGFPPRGLHTERLALVAAVNEEPNRPVEGRLTGGFQYAPPPSATRGPATGEHSPDVRMAAGSVERFVAAHPGADANALAGAAYLATGDPDRAVEAFERAVHADPRRAAFVSDLAAAYLARATAHGDRADLDRALSAVDRALALDPVLPEALFNRVVVLHRMNRDTSAARAAYRQVDPQSAWARELGQ